MQLYWIPIITACVSLLVAGVRTLQNSKLIAYALTLLTVAGFAVLISAYQGVNSDWRTYRSFVENCEALRCTYFEPGYDFLTFISASTLGFVLLKILLIACFASSVVITNHMTSSRLIAILAAASIAVATLPLTLGAIRQALTLPLLLSAAYLLQKRRYGWALLATFAAGSLHYSALVAGLWYSTLWYFFYRKPTLPGVFTVLTRVCGLICATYLILDLLSQSSIGETVSLVARIGETGAGTDFILTGGFERDLVILMERIPFAFIALVVFIRHASLSITERVFLLMYVAGSTFFVATFAFDRNIAGRTMATFRIADVLVLVTVIRWMVPSPLRRLSLPLALVAALLFVVSKSYMTMATVGFFDE